MAVAPGQQLRPRTLMHSEDTLEAKLAGFVMLGVQTRRKSQGCPCVLGSEQHQGWRCHAVRGTGWGPHGCTATWGMF